MNSASWRRTATAIIRAVTFGNHFCSANAAHPRMESEYAGAAQSNQSARLKLQDQKGNPLAPGYYFIGVKGSPLNYTTNFYQASIFIVATDNITLKATSSEGLAWVTDLENGAPQAECAGDVLRQGFQSGWSDNLHRSKWFGLSKGNQRTGLRARRGTNHLAFVSTDWGSGVWTGDLGIAENYYGNTNAPFAYLYTDRPIYRPGQDVFFKGLVRQNDDLHYSLLNDAQVYVTIDDPSGQQVYAKYLPLSQLGSHQRRFQIRRRRALGTYTISVQHFADFAITFGYLDLPRGGISQADFPGQYFIR